LEAVAKIDSSAVWCGEELATRDDWIWQFDSQEIEELYQLDRRYQETPLEAVSGDGVEGGLARRLSALQRQLEHGSGATWVRGFPADRFSNAAATRLFWIMAQRIGTPLSQSASGERLFGVRDAGFGKEDARTRGPNTRRKLSFHTDRCDVIGFMCLQQAKEGGESQLVSSAAVYNRISERRPDLLAELLRPFYYQRHNVDLGSDVAYCRQPVFSFFQGHFATSFLRVLIDRADASGEVPPMSDRQREALDYLEEVCEDAELQYRFTMQRGDLLFLNNWSTLHRRTAFTDWPEPERRRHLLRIWLSVPNSRPLDPLFADNFGDTRAGAVRGGMRAAPGGTG